MTTSAAPLCAATSAIAGSARKPDMSLIMAAPSASARRATKALVVSTETGAASRGSSAASTEFKPRPFLRLGDGNEAGPGRFRADVNDVRAGGGHGPTMGERRLRRDETAAVGEGIRRDVEDAHDEGRGVEPGDQRVGRGPGFGVRIHRATWVHRRLG